MNTITLADLTDDNASSGNSLLAVTQQLSISLGVAISAAVLRFYEGFDNASTVQQFHYTFITMGAHGYKGVVKLLYRACIIKTFIEA